MRLRIIVTATGGRKTRLPSFVARTAALFPLRLNRYSYVHDLPAYDKYVYIDRIRRVPPVAVALGSPLTWS